MAAPGLQLVPLTWRRARPLVRSPVWMCRKIVVNKDLLNKGTNLSYMAEMYPSTVLELRA